MTTRVVARYFAKRARTASFAKAGDADGSYMSVQNLQSLRDHATTLLQDVGPRTKLPDWVEAKIDRAAANLLDVMEYMEHGEGALPPNERGY
jgi:hypothetical protein